MHSIVDRDFLSSRWGYGIVSHGWKGSILSSEQPMNIQNPPRPPATAPRRAAASPRRTPKGRQVDPQALDEVQALLGDRPRRRDLLIEHLHLIQDKYGHLSARASRRARRRDEAGADRGLRGRDLLRAFRCGEGRRDAAAAGHRARLRLPVLRDGGRRTVCCTTCRRRSAPDVRVVRAPCMGACDHAPVCAVGHVQVIQRDAEASVTAVASAHDACACADSPAPISSTIMAAGGYRAARRMPRPASARATT